MVNGSNTLIKKLNVTANGRPVYDCDYANHCVNIKNLLELIILPVLKVLEQMNFIFLIHQEVQKKLNTRDKMLIAMVEAMEMY